LINRKLSKSNLGDQIITTAACFPTRINSIIQNNFVPVLLDIEQSTYNVEIFKLKGSLTKRQGYFLNTYTWKSI
jgi:CDP-6-deoxy-D-xylo-4-hexulose-3-dehydrase